MHFPLHPETPPQGRAISDLFKGRRADERRAFQERMKAMADAEGLPWGERTMTYNSRLAQELGKWGDTQPGGERLHDVLFRAYFVDNRNIGDVDTLVELAGGAGLDANEAREVLAERTFSDAVDDDWRRAQELGLTGVPTFVHDDLCVVGCQPYEVLMRFVNHLRQQRAQPPT